MLLETIETREVDHSGYGAGSGRVINNKYVCPCGEGIVFYEKDDIPGFRESDTWTNCKQCDKKYNFKRNNAELK